MSSSIPPRKLAIGAMATAFAIGASPVLAQTTSDEVVVTARWRGAEMQTLSTPVSYRDLDLTTASGRDALKKRVKDTAAEACRRLGEHNMGGTAAQTSCEQDAINSAAGQEQVAFSSAKPRPPR